MAIDFQGEIEGILDRGAEKKSLAEQKLDYQKAEQAFLAEIKIACNRPGGLETEPSVLLFSSSTEVSPGRNRDSISRRITAQRNTLGDIVITYVTNTFRVHHSAGTPYQLAEWRKDFTLTSTADRIIKSTKRQKSVQVIGWDGVSYDCVSTEKEKPVSVIEYADQTQPLTKIADLLHQEREKSPVSLD